MGVKLEGENNNCSSAFLPRGEILIHVCHVLMSMHLTLEYDVSLPSPSRSFELIHLGVFKERLRALPLSVGEEDKLKRTMETRSLALDRLICPITGSVTCDVCFRTINVGEPKYACLECYGWVPPESTTRNVRHVELQQRRVLQIRGVTVETSQTQDMMGYDLCISCARTTNAHMETGHHFALWVTR